MSGVFAKITYERDRRLCICGMLATEASSLPEEIKSEVRRFININLEWLSHVFAQGQTDGSIHNKAPAEELAAR